MKTRSDGSISVGSIGILGRSALLILLIGALLSFVFLENSQGSTHLTIMLFDRAVEKFLIPSIGLLAASVSKR